MSTTNEEEVLFEGDLSKALGLAALSNPHFCITQFGDNVFIDATPDFDMDCLFGALREMARKKPRFKAKLADYVIDLSKECEL